MRQRWGADSHFGTWMIVLILAFFALLLFWVLTQNMGNNGSGSGNDKGGSNGDEEIVWGVDSASYTTDEFYQCVVDNYGDPGAWGRYLGTVEGVSQGLDQDEVAFLHEKDIAIIPIYNKFSDATGNENGQNEAEEAIAIAEDLGTPDGVYLFADIEPSYPVDSAFIQGWTETIASSNYEPGIYGVFDEGSDLSEAFEAAASENSTVADEVVVWTAYPQEEVTTKENAPEFNPEAPESANALIWQYGIEGEACNIDTNLLKGEVMEGLW